LSRNLSVGLVEPLFFPYFACSMSNSRILYIFLVFSLLCLTASAQEESTSFERISVKEGLSQVSVYSIVQDKDGFMWFGTDDGLNRYDGYDIKVYRNSVLDSNSISNNTINTLFVDSEKNLWIGTNQGLNLFDPTIDGFIKFGYNYVDSMSISGNVVWCMTEDLNGQLWVGTNNGLNRFNREEKNFTRYKFELEDPNSLSNNSINAMLLDDDGKLWLGTNKGVNLYQPLRDNFRRISARWKEIEDYSGADVIQSMAISGKNKFFIGTNRGLYQMSNDTLSRLRNKFIGRRKVNVLHQDSKGDIWIGTNYGIVRHIKEENRWVRHKHNVDKLKSLSNDNVTAIYEDETGIVWIGTYSGGVNKYYQEQQQFVHFQKNNSDFRRLPSDKVLALMEQDNADLYIGTDKGLAMLNLEDYELKNERLVDLINAQGDIAITAITQVPNQFVAIGTESKGLFFYDRKTQKLDQFVSDVQDSLGISDNRITSLLYAHNYLWIGTDGGGLNRYSFLSKKFKSYEYDPGNSWTIRSNNITSLVKGQDGEIWIGTASAGIFRLKLGSKVFEQFRFEPNGESSLSDNYVLSLHYTTGTLWIGTRGGGLDKFQVKDSTWTNYNDSKGLSNNVVYSIVKDKEQSLWLTTNKGVSVFNPTTESFINYDEVDGLGNQTFNMGCGLMTSKNQLFFGGIQGMDLINYQEIGNRHYVTLSNVPPGSYTLQVKAANNEAIWNEEPKEISFVKEPQFYEENWFKFLVVIGLLAMTYGLYLIRVNRERKYSKMLEDKVETRTKIIAQERDEKGLLLQEIHHRVKNNLQIINSLLRLQSHFVTDKEALWALDESQSRVLSMADIHEKMYKTDNLSDVDIREYFNELGERLISTYDLKDSISSDISISVRNLNLDTLTPLGLIINEIITNSLKYGFPNQRKGTIKIYLDRYEDHNKFKLVIGDNGIGIPDGKLFGSEMSMGSQLIIGLTDQINGTLRRLPEQGTVYELIFEEINK